MDCAAPVVTTSGLDRAARRRARAAASVLGVDLCDDLTDQTTHLVARSLSPWTAKMSCAARLDLPIVMPAWLEDSAARGRLLGARGYEHPLRARDDAAVASTPALSAGGVVRSPLRLLRAAPHGRVDLTNGGRSIELDGACYQLDAPTTFLREGTVEHPLPASSAEIDAGCGAPGYSLASLLFARECDGLSHPDYFLACVRHQPFIAPMQLLDRKALRGALGGAEQLLEPRTWTRA